MIRIARALPGHPHPVDRPGGCPAAAGASSASWDGRCTEIASEFSVPVENVGLFIPEEFTILGEGSGNAL